MRSYTELSPSPKVIFPQSTRAAALNLHNRSIEFPPARSISVIPGIGSPIISPSHYSSIKRIPTISPHKRQYIQPPPTTTISKFRTHSVTRDQAFSDLQTRNEQLDNENRQQKTEIMNLNHTLQIKSQDIFNLNQIIGSLENSIRQSNSKSAGMKDQASIQMTSIKGDLREKDEQIQALIVQKQELQSEIKIWQDNYEKAEKQFNFSQDTAKFQIEELEKKNAQLLKQLKQMHEKVLIQQNQHYTVQQENSNLQLIIEDMNVQLMALMKNSLSPNDIQHYEQELAKLRIQNKELYDRMQVFEREKIEYKSQINQQREEMEFFRIQGAEHTQNMGYLRSCEQKIQFLTAENQRLNKILVGRCRDMNSW